MVGEEGGEEGKMGSDNSAMREAAVLSAGGGWGGKSKLFTVAMALVTNSVQYEK
jgi:hypothetical protein